MATILIVDDIATNRELIVAYLDGEGHTLLEADSGVRALAVAKERKPDLVLLDVMMPGLNGFEVAQQLKAMAVDEYLPVIFVTALQDSSSRLLAFRVGADEYLRKPVDRFELTTRIRNLLALREKEQALVRKNLEQMELHRFKEELSALLVHDLKNPMSVILANNNFVKEGLKSGDPAYLEALADSQSAAERILRLLANLMDLARLEARRLDLNLAPLRLASLLGSTVAQRAVVAAARGLKLEAVLDDSIEVQADADLLSRIVENILDNAIRHTPQAGRIEVRCSATHEAARIEIGNTGPLIPPAARAIIFEKFGQATPGAGRMNLGLGLYFCRLAIEAHGGRIWVGENDAFPTVFGMELPSVRPADAAPRP